MAHMVETMAYAGELPWHRLGNLVSDCVTVDEMLVAAGLNWKVEARPLFTVDGAGQQIKLPTKMALVRDSDDKVLSVIGNNWKPLQNHEAMEFFREFAEAGNIKLETAGSLKGGKVVWALAKLNTGFYVNGKHDKVEGYILLISPHEPGAAIQIRITTVRVVCANTMAMAENERNAPVFRIHHTTEFNVEKAKEAVGLSKERIGKAELEAKALAQLKMSQFDTIRFLSKFFTELKSPTDEDVKSLVANENGARSKKFDQVLESIESAPGAMPGTAWGVMNGLTHWSDHVAGKPGDYRLTKSWLGENDRMKTKAYTELLQMAA